MDVKKHNAEKSTGNRIRQSLLDSYRRYEKEELEKALVYPQKKKITKEQIDHN